MITENVGFLSLWNWHVHTLLWLQRDYTGKLLLQRNERIDEVALGATFALHYTRSMLGFSFVQVKNVALKPRRNTLLFFFFPVAYFVCLILRMWHEQ